MKNNMVLILLLSFATLLLQSGNVVASPKKKDIVVENMDPETVWPVVKAALLKEGIQMGEISCDRQTAKSAPFTYTFITSILYGAVYFYA